MRFLSLIVRGGLSLFREGGQRLTRGVARFEEKGLSRLAALPSSFIEAGALFARAVLKGSGEGLFAVAAALLLVLLFVLLR